MTGLNGKRPRYSETLLTLEIFQGALTVMPELAGLEALKPVSMNCCGLRWRLPPAETAPS